MVSVNRNPIHTTLDKDLFNKEFLPFTDEKIIAFNAVLEAMIEIVYNLCKQNNLPICSVSLFKMRDEILGNDDNYNQLHDKIVIEIDPISGKTTFSISDQNAEIAKNLLVLAEKIVQDNAGKILVLARDEKDTPTERTFRLAEKILILLKKNNGEMYQRDIWKHFDVSRTVLSMAIQKLEDKRKIKKERRGTINLIKLIE